jgi:hypothetical protein
MGKIPPLIEDYLTTTPDLSIDHGNNGQDTASEVNSRWILRETLKSVGITILLAAVLSYFAEDQIRHTYSNVTDVFNYFAKRPGVTTQFNVKNFYNEACMVYPTDADIRGAELEKAFVPFESEPNRPQVEYFAYAINKDKKSLEYFGKITGRETLKLTSRSNSPLRFCGTYDSEDTFPFDNIPPQKEAAQQFKAMLKETYGSYDRFPIQNYLQQLQQVGAGTSREIALAFTVEYDPQTERLRVPNITNDSGGFHFQKNPNAFSELDTPYSVDLIMLPNEYLVIE